MASLLEKWYPVTHDFGLIQAPLDQVLRAFEAWQRTLGIEFTRTEIASSLAEALESLLPLAHSKMRRLFIATRSDWVVCFQNGIHGSDPLPAMSFLALRMGVPAMRVCSTPHGVTYSATIWEVYAPEALGGRLPLGYRRSIAASNDGGRWVFEESGERYPFEQTGRYAAARRRDRFTRDMLRDYLRHFGIEPFADAFMRIDAETPAILLQQRTKMRHTPEYTLEQVVAGDPWRRPS